MRVSLSIENRIESDVSVTGGENLGMTGRLIADGQVVPSTSNRTEVVASTLAVVTSDEVKGISGRNDRQTVKSSSSDVPSTNRPTIAVRSPRGFPRETISNSGSLLQRVKEKVRLTRKALIILMLNTAISLLCALLIGLELYKNGNGFLPYCFS